MYDLSEKDYRKWKYAGEKWFQKTKEKIAAEKSAKLISYKEFDLSNEKYKEWKSAYEEQLQEMKQRMKESPPDPHKYSDSQRQLYFSSERGDLSLDQWALNLYNSSEKKAQKAVLGDTPPSSDTISNDADKELAITDIAGGTGVTTEFKEDINLLPANPGSTPIISVPNSSSDTNGILSTVSTNSYSVNDTEQSDNKDQYSSDIDEEKNLDEKASVTISDIANKIGEELSVIDEELPVTDDDTYLSIDNSEAFSYSVNDTKPFDNEEQNSYIDRKIESDNASQYGLSTDKEEIFSENVNITDGNGKIEDTEDATYLSVDNSSGVLSSGASSSTNDKYPAVDTKSPFASLVGVVTSAWYSFTKMFHSKTKPTGDAVFNSLPEKSSFVGDNLNDDVDAIGCISETYNNLFDQD